MATLKGTLTPAHTVRGEMSIGGGGGSNNYEDLDNKPSVDGVVLVGNVTHQELGLYSQEEVDGLLASLVYDLLPTDNASGPVATFSTALAKPLISIEVENVATKVYQRGANVWDEDWEVGTYNTNTGAKSSSTTRIRSKNLIPIAPNSTLRFTPIGSAGYGLSFLFYDKNGTFKNGYYRGSTAGGFSYATQADWYFVAISPGDAYGTTYNNDIAVRFDNSFDYVAYNPNSNEYVIADLGNIATFEGINNIFADDGNVLECKFKDTIQHYIDKLV